MNLKRRLGRVVKKKKDFVDMMRDPDGENHVKEMGAKLKAEGKQYVDPHFPADQRMLFSDPKNPASYMQNIKSTLDKGLIRWLRPNEMGNTAEPFQVFAHGIDPEDINQGHIGDCYFLAALAICATREELINDLIVEDCAEQGIYGVKFYAKGKWTTVIVDDLFPCWEVGKEWLPIFAKWKGEKETWAMVAEKAWAKLHGSYEAIDGGRTEDALGYLSGGCTVTTYFKDRDNKFIPEISSGVLFERLLRDHASNGHDMGCFMSASGVAETPAAKKGNDNPDAVSKGEHGLVSGHAYSVLNIREVEGNRLIELRNPWGSFEWDGDWSDNSPLWTESIKKTVGFVAADDGAFWMSFADFTKEYNQIGVCKTVHADWTTRIKHGHWKAPEHAGGPSEPLAHFNPTFELANHDPVVWIQLEQPDQRRTRHDWTLCTLRLLRKPKDGELLDINNAVVTMNLSERQRTVELEDLDPAQGPYVIVLTAWGAGVEGEYYLTVHSPGELHLKNLHTPKPSAAEAALLAKVDFPHDKCGTCKNRIVEHDKKSIKGLAFHEGCFKCRDCGSADVYDIGKEGGEWRGYCFGCWNPKFGEKCIFCEKSVQVTKSGGEPCASVLRKGKLHQQCREAWKQAELLKTASHCFYCSKPILAVPGEFSGEYYAVDGRGQIHAECHQRYKYEVAPRCIHCTEPVLEVPGRFSGEYYNMGGGQLHAECQDAYNQSQAKKCLECSFALLTIEGRFTGRFLPVSNAGVHEECLVAWKAKSAEKCFFCQQPAIAIPGKYSGSYYDIPGKGKLHEECHAAFKRS